MLVTFIKDSNQNFDLSLLKFEEHTLSLGRIDICFSRPNAWSHTSKSFDAFLVDSRSQIQYRTNTKYIKLQDFLNGKILQVYQDLTNLLPLCEMVVNYVV
jgi:hypothetical protein